VGKANACFQEVKTAYKRLNGNYH